MRQWLALRFEAPLMAFGSVAIDHVGRTGDFPAASMLTGLMGNALGWDWADTAAHQALQDRLVFAARRDREGTALTDTQNAWLRADDRGWTTGGKPEGRRGATYGTPHRRRRDYSADALVRVVLTLEPAAERPGLEDLAAALHKPSRPLFLGRRPCLPAAPFLGSRESGWVEGRDSPCGVVRPGRRTGTASGAMAPGRGTGGWRAGQPDPGCRRFAELAYRPAWRLAPGSGGLGCAGSCGLSALHLVRLPLRMDALARWAGERGWGGGRRGAVFDEGRALHHLLAEAFGPDAVNCFRQLVAPGSGAGNLYLYSSEDSEALRAAAKRWALPEHLGALPLAQMKAGRCRLRGVPGRRWV